MMQRRLSLLVGILLLVVPAPAYAQAPAEIDMTQPEGGAEATPDTAPPDEESGDAGALDEKVSAAGARKGGKKRGDGESWKDVVVVNRKPFLKLSRFEFAPTYGITVNDTLIRHHLFGGQINYFLTDVLAVGLEGQYFISDLQPQYDQIGLQDRRSPTANEYKYGGALNFHYTPIYAKFALANQWIIHWEAFFTLGVGVTRSEIIPRDPPEKDYPRWQNTLITPNVGFTTRVFLTKWMTLHLGVRDYIFNDKFENINRMAKENLDDSIANSTGKFINHIMLQAGVSFWLPTSFRYTTSR